MRQSEPHNVLHIDFVLILLLKTQRYGKSEEQNRQRNVKMENGNGKKQTNKTFTA